MLWGGKRTYQNLTAIYHKLMKKKKKDRIRLEANRHFGESNVFFAGEADGHKKQEGEIEKREEVKRNSTQKKKRF